MDGTPHDHVCTADDSMEPTTYLLTDENYERAVILESPPSSSAVVRIMRAWPAPAGTRPHSQTYGQYGIIHEVPSSRVLYAALADGTHSLPEVVPTCNGDNMRAGGYDDPFVAIHPPEPDCPHAPKDGKDRGHLWGAHLRVSGCRIEDKPGISPDAAGRGLIIREHCTRPSCYATRTRETDAVDDGHDAETECYLRITYGELPAESRADHDTTYGPNPRVLQADALKLIPDDGEYHDIVVEWRGREYLMACTVGGDGDSHVCPGARRIPVYAKVWTGGTRVISVDGSGRYIAKPKVAGLQLLTTFCDACGLEADAHPDIAVEAAG